MGKHEKIWNVPNILTMFRIVLIGVFIWLFAEGYLYGSLAVFLLASLTDVLDGYIARKHNLITNFGKLMDPIADKLMLMTVLICLATAKLVPLWVVIVIVVKEVLMILGGYGLLHRGYVVEAKWIGKLATVVFFLAVVITFFHDQVAPFDTYLQYFAVGLSVLALLWYAVEVLKSFRRAKK